MPADISPNKFLQLCWLMALILIASLAFAGADGNDGYDAETVFFADCQVGNLNPPIGPPVPELFQGDETYAYHILPSGQCSSTDNGFILESITQLLHFNDQQIPSVVTFNAALLEAIFDANSGCWSPGPSLYTGPTQSVVINGGGITPIQALTPGVQPYLLVGHYFLAMQYSSGTQAQLVVDDDPQPCTEYVNRGTGWEDLFGQKRSGGGKIIVFGDIIFAPASVTDTTTSWDAIKSMYK